MSWRDKRRNNWVLEKIGSELTLRRSIDSRKLQYFVHICRNGRSVEKEKLKVVVIEDVL